MSNTLNRFVHINQRIEQALSHSGRSADDAITLLAVSKRHSLEKIHALYELGQRHFGESYLQEALTKINTSPYSDIIWHFIGPIQSNKTKDIAQNFQWVHSVDRIKIARRLSAQSPDHSSPLNICLQINISQEVQKSGFSSSEIYTFMEEIINLPNLAVRGLMAIPEPTNNVTLQKKAFHQLKELMTQLNKEFKLNMDTLSMGMSNDLESAIAEGATIIRVGTALFGAREY
ncbi:MAG: YggS family pyridoxal phosphate-dependent enzyme [gamma proteobacterium symbiont of Bathyaustriella thionipta]|nr:YggS family pyridoxal phosphate-dependent enzyme [gamma proteobacterium symbiont of Bathyaustriella thionipta]MCU7949905.1 YggS family pyridoxal phosphate-dependent enzyme [gamma proteobacterium symbiont of Bathyaustriella thionipta]MCU7954061.1 YggS family pyridoxal phosphate-dependent enzyme [gamma proteobacterium symbiont of Bathyaustriella thionipta]MCU7956502.1 YggS family pyridoxal phosphate-dependent enzyme [gamma proteobacterium symbiont of Bathyaustriella thionipta]MCU7968556.1 YggS